MSTIFILIEEDMDGARPIFASADKSIIEDRMKKDYSSLHFVGGDIWRSGSAIVTIQEVELG